MNTGSGKSETTSTDLYAAWCAGYGDGLKAIVEAAEQVIIAYGMGWDMDGVIQQLRASLPADSVCRTDMAQR